MWLVGIFLSFRTWKLSSINLTYVRLKHYWYRAFILCVIFPQYHVNMEKKGTKIETKTEHPLVLLSAWVKV